VSVKPDEQLSFCLEGVSGYAVCSWSLADGGISLSSEHKALLT
jgi:hypothetical protein